MYVHKISYIIIDSALKSKVLKKLSKIILLRWSSFVFTQNRKKIQALSAIPNMVW